MLGSLLSAAIGGIVQALAGKALDAAARKLLDRLRRSRAQLASEPARREVDEACARAVEVVRRKQHAAPGGHTPQLLALLDDGESAAEITEALLTRGRPDFDSLREVYLGGLAATAAEVEHSPIAATLESFCAALEDQLLTAPLLGPVLRDARDLVQKQKLEGMIAGLLADLARTAAATERTADATEYSARTGDRTAGATERTAEATEQMAAHFGRFLNEAEREAPPVGRSVPALDSALRTRVLDLLEPYLADQGPRRNLAGGLADAGFRLSRKELDGYATARQAAAAALGAALETGEPMRALRSFLEVVAGELGSDHPSLPEKLGPLRAEVDDQLTVQPGPDPLQIYLQRVARDHRNLIPFLDHRPGLEELHKIYVELELRSDDLLRGDGPSSPTKGGDRPLRGRWTLDELLALTPDVYPGVTRRWVLLGDPGAGKTSLLRHLAYRLATDGGRWVPVFERLPVMVREGGSVFDRIVAELERAGHAVAGLKVEFERVHREGRLLFLLDGLDEVGGDRRPQAERLLGDLADRWQSASIVVTSRPIPFRPFDARFRDAALAPFDHERRREFLARWFGRDTGEPDWDRADAKLPSLESDPDLRDLASIPFFLTFMALLIEGGEDPNANRAFLYDQILTLLLEGKQRDPPRAMDGRDTVRRVLGYLGYGMTRDNRDAEPLAALENRLIEPEASSLRGELARALPRWESPRAFLKELAERTAILGPQEGRGEAEERRPASPSEHAAELGARPRGDPEWRYLHRSFREALAAAHLEGIYRGEDGEAEVLEWAGTVVGNEDQWAEPYALLAGRVSDPDALVLSLVEANRPLGLRALATAQTLREETLGQVLALAEAWEERATVYLRIPELLGGAQRSLDLLRRLRRGTRDGNDLYFLDRAVAEVARRWPEARRRAEGMRRRFYDHIPRPQEELLRTVETPLDGPVPLWCPVQVGSYVIGSPEDEGRADEHPRHEVHLVSPFRIGAVPVTNAQYAAFDPGHEPRAWKGVATEELSHHPVVNVTWYAAVSFCRWLACLGGDLAGARLPTEEEWEVACRAGSTHRYWAGDGEEDLARVGWYGANAKRRTHRVGEKPRNPWGLYDAHGNVWEWTLNQWDAERYQGREEAGYRLDPATVDPEADLPADPAGGGGRVLRGGSCWDDAVGARAAVRNVWLPRHEFFDRGFRVLLPATPSDRS